MTRLKLDFFSYIRLVNFLRAEKPELKEINAAKDDSKWRDDKYMKPVIMSKKIALLSDVNRLSSLQRSWKMILF